MERKAEQVLPRIYRIPVPLTGNPLKELNSYVIVGDGGDNLLVDTGFHTTECKEAIEDALGELGISMKHTDILLTHMHTDHTGNAAELLCEGRKALIGEIDQVILTRYNHLEGVSNNHWVKKERFRTHGVPAGVLEEMFRKTPSRTMMDKEREIVYTPLTDGELLTYGGYTLRAIHTPGHTPGHMCFEIVGTGAMILGDHVLFDISPNITDWANVEDSLGDYLESLDKIDRYEVTIPLPAHRKGGDFHERIAALKRHHKRRLGECKEIVASLDHATLYEIASRMKWKIRADSWEAFPAGQKWFALGECLAHLDHLVKYGQVRRHEAGDGMEVTWYEV